jgi:hypothetical protein
VGITERTAPVSTSASASNRRLLQLAAAMGHFISRIDKYDVDANFAHAWILRFMIIVLIPYSPCELISGEIGLAETTYQEAWAVFPDLLKELIEPKTAALS